MATNTIVSTFTSTLVDAWTDGGYGTGWENLHDIDDVLREGQTVEGFLTALRGVSAFRWNTWAEQIGVAHLSQTQIKSVIVDVGEILAPLADLPVTTVVGHGVKRDDSSRRFVGGMPPRVSPETDQARRAFATELLRDGFRFDMTYAEWVSADGNTIGRISSDDEGVWLSKPLPSTEKLRFVPRQGV